MARESLSLDSHPNFGVGWVGLFYFLFFHFRVSKLTIWGTSRESLNFV